MSFTNLQTTRLYRLLFIVCVGITNAIERAYKANNLRIHEDRSPIPACLNDDGQEVTVSILGGVSWAQRVTVKVPATGTLRYVAAEIHRRIGILPSDVAFYDSGGRFMRDDVHLNDVTITEVKALCRGSFRATDFKWGDNTLPEVISYAENPPFQIRVPRTQQSKLSDNRINSFM